MTPSKVSINESGLMVGQEVFDARFRTGRLTAANTCNDQCSSCEGADGNNIGC